MLKTPYKDSAMGKTQVYQRFSHFKEGETSLDDKPRSGCPSTSRIGENVENVHAIMLEDRQRTIEEISKLSGITWSLVQRILSEDLK